MNTALMFSTGTDNWSTPQELFDVLNAEFHFTIDAAASAENHKCSTWYGPGGQHEDALALVEWGRPFCRETIWINPPYSRGLQGKFIQKAAQQCRVNNHTVVMLLPARTDTKAFHAHIYDASKWQAREGVEIRFLPGRLKFGGAKDSAPFPSMIVVFHP
jgi:site-specific DNA-methyltransferase (adenine-specific)